MKEVILGAGWGRCWARRVGGTRLSESEVTCWVENSGLVARRWSSPNPHPENLRPLSISSPFSSLLTSLQALPTVKSRPQGLRMKPPGPGPLLLFRRSPLYYIKLGNVATFPAPRACSGRSPCLCSPPAPPLRLEDLEDQRHVSLTRHSLVWPVSEVGINGVILYVFFAAHRCSSTDINHLFLLLHGLPLCDHNSPYSSSPLLMGLCYLQSSSPLLSFTLFSPPPSLSPPLPSLLPSLCLFSSPSTSSPPLLLPHSCKQLCCKHWCPRTRVCMCQSLLLEGLCTSDLVIQHHLSSRGNRAIDTPSLPACSPFATREVYPC